MTKNREVLLARYSKLKYILILIVFTIIINAGFHFMLSEIDTGIPDTKICYTPDELYQTLSEMGNEGRRSYITAILVLDFLYPLIYGTLLALIIYSLSGRLLISLLPVTATIFDFTENMSIIYLASIYPEKISILAQAASWSTTLKWSGIFISAAIILTLGIIRLVIFIKKERKHEI